MRPLRFHPRFKPVLWGGERLRPFLGHAPSQEPTGEAWLLSDVRGAESITHGGPDDGRTLRDLMDRSGEEILGRSAPQAGRFPLLLKLLDAEQTLSVQVHPDDAMARRLEPDTPGLGKTEAWVVLGVEPHGMVYAGLRDGVGRATFDLALDDGTLADLLREHRPEIGDTIFLPAGAVHAIGGGLMIFEVQQTSDITYRLFDWNRVDPLSGKARELHTDKGRICSDVAMRPDVLKPRPGMACEPLVSCEQFRLCRRRAKAVTPIAANGYCRVLALVDGAAKLDDAHHSEPMRLGRGGVSPGLGGRGRGRAVRCGGGDVARGRRAGAPVSRSIDLSADLGEGAGSDAQIMPLISMAHVGCAAHAADPREVERTIRLALKHGVRIGAHPAYPDAANFGRTRLDIPLSQLTRSLHRQVGLVVGLAKYHGADVAALKPHGALYHAAADDPAISSLILDVADAFGLALVGPPRCPLADASASRGLEYLGEGFADRRYGPDGRLLPRSDPNAVIRDGSQAAAQCLKLLGDPLIRTICVHGDSPGAANLLRELRAELAAVGVEVRA